MAVLPDGPGVQDAEDMEAYRALDLNHDDQRPLLTNSSLLFTGVLLTHPYIDANLLGPRGSLLGGVQISTNRRASFCWPIN